MLMVSGLGACAMGLALSEMVCVQLGRYGTPTNQQLFRNLWSRDSARESKSRKLCPNSRGTKLSHAAILVANLPLMAIARTARSVSNQKSLLVHIAIREPTCWFRRPK